MIAAKRVLMIAYHYPPYHASSGVQRTLAFSRYLRRHNWQPVMLTPHLRAYPAISPDQCTHAPEGVTVKRAFALDTARHLAICGVYFSWMALPDRWISWVAGAVPLGLRLIHQYRPQLIWSTYPIATAHLIASILHRLSRIPWIADFRDPMVETDPRTGQSFPQDPKVRRVRLFVEKVTVNNTAAVVFCTNGARAICINRYPKLDHSRWSVIANGFDEQIFAAVENSQRGVRHHSKVVLVHSGTLYPGMDRDPTAFFNALSFLLARQAVLPEQLRVVLRASGYEDHYRRLIKGKGLGNLVFLEPAIPYREAIAEMLTADGLLLFQGYTSNPAIPAKLYEYIRAQRPILAMVDAQGDTADLLRKIGIGTCVPLEDAQQIADGLSRFLWEVSAGQAKVATHEQINLYSREAETAELARIFSNSTSKRPHNLPI